jgi:hypothetical protein
LTGVNESTLAGADNNGLKETADPSHDDSMEIVPKETVTGKEAEVRARPLNRLLLAGIVITIIAVGSAWLRWHSSVDQLGLPSLGLGMVLIAVMVWRYKIVGFSFQKGFNEPITLTLAKTPLPRAILAPFLTVLGHYLSLLALRPASGRY